MRTRLFRHAAGMTLFAVLLSGQLALAGRVAALTPTPPPTFTRTATPTSTASGSCAPLDFVFVIDDSSSMDGAINNVKSEIDAIINKIIGVSAGNYQMAVVLFDAVDQASHKDVRVQVDLAPNNEAAVRSAINGLTRADPASVDRAGRAGPDANILSVGESSDEALNTVINRLPAAGRPKQQGDFNGVWRAAANKIILLVTDAPPSGFDTTYHEGVDDVNAAARAQQAQSAGIRISSVFVPTPENNPFRTTTVPIMQNYAAVTGSVFSETASNGTGTATAINRTLDSCGVATPTPTIPPTITPTGTPTLTSTATATRTATPTAGTTRTATPTTGATRTATSISTRTATPTTGATRTATATRTPSATRTATPTPSARAVTINMPRPVITGANVRNYPVGGACQPGATVTVTVGTLTQAVTCTANGTYITYTNATSLPEGPGVPISVQQRMAVGPVGNPSVASATTIKDTVGPPVAITSPDVVTSRLPTFTGTSEPQALVVVIIDLDNRLDTTNDRVVYHTVVDSDGQWQLDLATATPKTGTLPEGGLAKPSTISLGAVARDQYNNQGSSDNKPISVR